MTALLFPGQGTQRVGMGQALFHGFDAAAAVLAQSSLLTGRDLAALLRRGPGKLLTRTEYAQVAVTTVNLAALAVLRSRAVEFGMVAGHSVGMLAALAAADVLDPPAVVRLAAQRGAIMGALPVGGSMVAVTGVTNEVASAAADSVRRRTAAPVVVALVNGPRQVVLSGEQSAVASAVQELKALGALSATPLAVSHAFHSPLMAPARTAWRETVAALPLRDARIPIVADTTGECMTDRRTIRQFLVEQLTGPVRWDLVCRRLDESGEHESIETGDSRALRSFCLAYPNLRVSTMTTPQFLASLRGPEPVASQLAERSMT